MKKGVFPLILYWIIFAASATATATADEAPSASSIIYNDNHLQIRENFWRGKTWKVAENANFRITTDLIGTNLTTYLELAERIKTTYEWLFPERKWLTKEKSHILILRSPRSWRALGLPKSARLIAFETDSGETIIAAQHWYFNFKSSGTGTYSSRNYTTEGIDKKYNRNFLAAASIAAIYRMGLDKELSSWVKVGLADFTSTLLCNRFQCSLEFASFRNNPSRFNTRIKSLDELDAFSFNAIHTALSDKSDRSGVRKKASRYYTLASRTISAIFLATDSAASDLVRLSSLQNTKTISESLHEVYGFDFKKLFQSKNKARTAGFDYRKELPIRFDSSDRINLFKVNTVTDKASLFNWISKTLLLDKVVYSERKLWSD